CIDLTSRTIRVGCVKFCPAMSALLLDELSNAQVEEVGGHFRGLLERDSLLLTLYHFGFDGHVRDDGEVSVGSDSNFEHCLVGRMVQAREDLASLNRFEVRAKDIAVAVGCLVKPGEVVRDLALELYLLRTHSFAGAHI